MTIIDCQYYAIGSLSWYVLLTWYFHGCNIKCVLLQYDPSKPLFGEMKFADKKKFEKRAFEFTQSRLSLYKDSKVSLPWLMYMSRDFPTYLRSGPGAC